MPVWSVSLSGIHPCTSIEKGSVIAINWNTKVSWQKVAWLALKGFIYLPVPKLFVRNQNLRKVSSGVIFAEFKNVAVWRSFTPTSTDLTSNRRYSRYGPTGWSQVQSIKFIRKYFGWKLIFCENLDTWRLVEEQITAREVRKFSYGEQNSIKSNFLIFTYVIKN